MDEGDERPLAADDRSMTQDLSPGRLVRHPLRPEWGVGQVQSAIDHRVTVNFEHAGKVLIDSRRVALTPVEEADR